jgi:cytoskeletal protein RodZ
VFARIVPLTNKPSLSRSLLIKPIGSLRHTPRATGRDADFSGNLLSGIAMPPDRLVTTPLGDVLRSERVRRGLTLGEIASATRIAEHHIKAIEKEDFHSLPAGVYRSSFLRQYARVLGLDENEIVRSFQERYPEAPLPLPEPAPAKRRSVPAALLWLPAATAALLGIHILWQTETRKQLHTEQRAAVVTEPAGHAERLREEPSEGPSEDPSDQPAVAATPAPDSVAALQVKFTAAEPVWVLVKCDGFETYTGTLAKSEVKQFEASRTMTALVGNAAGLTYSINGKNHGPTGAPGEVDLLEFTAEGVRILTRRSTPASAQ